MTREEAIRCLSVHSSTNGSGLCTDEQHYKAKQMAIKALSQEPCTDAVSLTKEAYSDLCLRASKADDLQRALDMEKGAYNALVKNIQCEDAISREDAIKAVYGMTRYTGIDEAPYEYAEHVISELPSVTQKSGRWIETDDKYGAFFICDKCHRQSDIMENFCPNCGARMESEG